MSASHDPTLSLVIPLYNEAGNVAGVARGLLAAFSAVAVDVELVLVDNGSADDTAAQVDRLAAGDARVVPIHLSPNRGYGGGILAGLNVARGSVLGYTWGDNQVRPADHVKVYDRLCEDHLDLCKACRVERHDGLRRKVITVCYNAAMRLVFGRIGTRDANGCPKLMRRAAYEALDLQSKNWFIDPEIILKARRRKLAVGEVPVIYHAREQGRSKVKLATLVEFTVSILRFRLTGRG